MSHQTNNIKCVSGDEKKYYVKFANSHYDEFRKTRFGIKSCSKGRKVWLDDLRHEILQYRKVDDTNVLCSVNIVANLVPSLSIMQDPMDKSNVTIKYGTSSSSSSIVEINTGGCITNLNITPVLNGPSAFKYNQDCNNPSDEWVINHNLNFVPNIWAEDCNGNDLDATIEVVDDNTIKLKFSQPVSGKAFLS